MLNEKERRLDLVRQYLMDIEANPNSLLECSDAVNYVRYNFHEAVKAALMEMDTRRRICRTMTNTKLLLDNKFEVVEIASPMVEMSVGRMDRHIQTEAKFSFWFHRTLLSPIVNEEERILRYSASPIIMSGGTIHSYVDRVADIFKFKLWETVHFPEAKDVPPRVEPTPDAVNPPAKLE